MVELFLIPWRLVQLAYGRWRIHRLAARIRREGAGYQPPIDTAQLRATAEALHKAGWEHYPQHCRFCRSAREEAGL